jgi:uncharacterized protein
MSGRVSLQRLVGPTVLVVVVALSLGFTGTALSALEVPFLAGRVNDLAEMLPEQSEASINARLRQLEEEYGAQVVVLTVPSLAGDSLEDFSLRVVETWKLGRGDTDDGVLFLIARDDRMMRIEVGYGLEPVLTDALSRRILDRVVRPRFREGDFVTGIEEGVESIVAAVAGQTEQLPAEQERRGPSATPFVFASCLIQLLFVIVVLWLINRLSRLFRGGAWATHRGRGGWVAPVVLGGGRRRGGGWGGGGFSGGGFSGGGGSFGGGGASGSW